MSSTFLTKTTSIDSGTVFPIPLQDVVAPSEYATARPLGNLDYSTAAAFEFEMAHLLERSEQIFELDLSHVESIDFNGVRVIQNCIFEMSDRGGVMLISGASPSVREVLDICGVLVEDGEYTQVI